MTEFIQETVDGTCKGNTRKFKAELFLAMFNHFYLSVVKQFYEKSIYSKIKGRYL